MIPDTGGSGRRTDKLLYRRTEQQANDPLLSFAVIKQNKNNKNGEENKRKQRRGMLQGLQGGVLRLESSDFVHVAIPLKRKKGFERICFFLLGRLFKCL